MRLNNMLTIDELDEEQNIKSITLLGIYPTKEEALFIKNYLLSKLNLEEPLFKIVKTKNSCTSTLVGNYLKRIKIKSNK